MFRGGSSKAQIQAQKITQQRTESQGVQGRGAGVQGCRGAGQLTVVRAGQGRVVGADVVWTCWLAGRTFWCGGLRGLSGAPGDAWGTGMFAMIVL